MNKERIICTNDMCQGECGECNYLEKIEVEQQPKLYTQRELEIAYCIGILNRMLTMEELGKELETAKEKIKNLMLAFERGDFNPQ